MTFKLWMENSTDIIPFPNSTVKQLVYHGTEKPFDEFDYKKSYRTVLWSRFEVKSHGFFFSESPHEAAGFGDYIAECYIDLKNPLLDPRRDRNLGIDRLDKKKEIDLQKILSPLIQKDERGYYIEIGVKKFYIKKRMYEFGWDWIYNAISSYGIHWDALDNENVIKKMISLGYDGTFVMETDGPLGRSIFVPFPNQIRVLKWHRKEDLLKLHGKEDDYYIQKKDGYHHFKQPF